MYDGKSVRLRALETEDLDLVTLWANDPGISASLSGWSFPVSRAQQDAWFAGTFQDSKNKRFIIEVKETHQVIGIAGLWDINLRNSNAFAGFKIGAKDIQGKGYGSDAMMTLMAYAFYEVGLHRLWGEMLPFNVASYKVCVDKCGWRVEGVFRQHEYRFGRLWDLIRLGILREDFERHPRAQDYLVQAPATRITIAEPDVSWVPPAFSETADSRPLL